MRIEARDVTILEGEIFAEVGANESPVSSVMNINSLLHILAEYVHASAETDSVRSHSDLLTGNLALGPVYKSGSEQAVDDLYVCGSAYADETGVRSGFLGYVRHIMLDALYSYVGTGYIKVS